MARHNNNRRASAIAGLLAVNAAPVVEVKSHGRYETEYAKFLRQREQEQAQVDALVSQNVALIRDLDREQRQAIKRFWGQSRWTSNMTSENVEKLRSLTDFSIDTGLQVADGLTTPAAAQQAGHGWFDNLEATRGISLSPAGFTRLINYAIAQAMLGGGKDFTMTSAFDAALDRLRSCDAFAEGEVAEDASLITVEQPTVVVPEVKPTVDDILSSVSLESREGRRLAVEAIDDQFWSVDVAAVWNEWINHLVTVHKFMPSESQQKAAVNFVRKYNLDPLAKPTWDRVRVALTKSHVFPSTLLTPEEQQIEEMEKTNTAQMSHSERRELANKLNQFRKPEDIL